MKKIHISESKLKSTFNESNELKSDLEKELEMADEFMKQNNYNDQNYSEENDDQTVDSDDEYATNYIVGRLFEAQEIMTDLIDYLTNSPYALEKGGEAFKKHLSKATNICNELENFWDNEETKQDIY